MRAWLLSACVLLAVGVGCSTEASSVVLLGDSLAEQAAPYLSQALPGYRLVPQFFGGTAPCDWVEKDLHVSSEDVMVVSFSGNSLTPCMSDGAGGFLGGQDLVDKYRRDVTSLIESAHSAGARVLLVGQPVQRQGDMTDALNAMYRELADQQAVAYVDAGAAVENADGTFAVSLPCIEGEPQCGPSGSNVVRSDDGVHFCPGAPPPGPCAVYASGAFRFAKAIAEVVNS